MGNTIEECCGGGSGNLKNQRKSKKVVAQTVDSSQNQGGTPGEREQMEDPFNEKTDHSEENISDVKIAKILDKKVKVKKKI